MASKYLDEDDTKHTQRFVDASREPCRMLLPIQGYHKAPLVWLEEAVEPIVSLVPDVRRMAYVAKIRSQESPTDVMSLDESASIMLYCMEWDPPKECLYFVLNASLRTENRNVLRPWFRYLRLIMSALGQLPWTHRFVYRGVKRDMRSEYAEGKTVVWWGFNSCTSSIQALESEQFLGETGARTLFTIECYSAIDIGQFSCFKDENEILLPPGQTVHSRGLSFSRQRSLHDTIEGDWSSISANWSCTQSKCTFTSLVGLK